MSLLEDRLQRLKKLAEEGKTRREIAQKLGLSYGYISSLAKQERISITQAYRGRAPRLSPGRPRVRLKPSDQAVNIKTALEQGERSLEALLKQAQCGILKLNHICRDYHITLPEDIIPYRWRPEIDVLIDKGLTLDEIAENVIGKTGKSLTRARVGQYIDHSGQHYFWRQQRAAHKQQGRQELEDEKDKQRATLYRVEQHIDKLAAGNFSLEKAVQYDRGRQRQNKSDSISFEKLVTFFQRYETTQQQGKKRSLKQLSRGLFRQMTAHYILKDVELPPLYGNCDVPSREVTQQKKELIARGMSTPLSRADLEHFTGIPSDSISKYITQEGGREQKVRIIGIKRFGQPGKTAEVLTYRLASEIFEAQDAQFTVDETIFLLDHQQQVVEYALKQKKEISKVIIDALRTMYPEKKIKKPYLLKEELPVFHDVKQEAMQRAFEQLPWTAVAISYFLDVDNQQVQRYFQQRGGKTTQRFLKSFGHEGKLTITTASKVYELQDKEMDEQQIQRRLHQPQRVIDYALQHRSEIEPEIIKGLQILFPEEKIRKPYR